MWYICIIMMWYIHTHTQIHTHKYTRPRTCTPMRDNLDFAEECSERHYSFVYARWPIRMWPLKDAWHFADVFSDMIHSCVWHDSFVRDVFTTTWRDSFRCALLRMICTSHTCVATHSSMLVTRFICKWPFHDNLLIHVTWLIQYCPFPSNENMHLAHICSNTTHSHMCLTWLIRMWPFIKDDLHFAHVCNDMSHWNVCDMTHSRVTF